MGTVIFDPDGEYYWPDDKNRPGLCDVAELENKIVVFTKKKGPGQDVEMVAARDNMTIIVKMLHDPDSQMIDMLIYSLKHGKICIIDVSQMRGEPALILSSLLLQKIFDHNQQQFTEAKPETIPTIAVVEEAQAVLGNLREIM